MASSRIPLHRSQLQRFAMASIASRPLPVSLSATSTPVSPSSASTMPTSVESKQGDDLGTVRFTNVQDLLNAIDHAARDSLTITSTALPSQEQGCKFRFRDYDSNSRILIITIPTSLHEQLHKGLYNEYIRQVHKRSWKNIASETFLTQQGHSGRSSKEGDSAGGPKPERATKGAWPTLVIEAGVSQTLRQLLITMQRWFSMSNHEVKIVILTKFDSTKILLEEWEEKWQFALELPQRDALFNIHSLCLDKALPLPKTPLPTRYRIMSLEVHWYSHSGFSSLEIRALGREI
ncbi:hypothetical protein B0H67DRAFT_672053 [Lasiosphaeris hirsuta]|uniref:Uncharacterized protein n=1 Tax=Lasiosphaeris hirsuta TaxID=260670 RepID=A0AA40DP12_9PEZI|nr:hypothetical protein B0H67DRAFT_672053 [Lasiosphaeris hirsuta]